MHFCIILKTLTDWKQWLCLSTVIVIASCILEFIACSAGVGCHRVVTAQLHTFIFVCPEILNIPVVCFRFLWGCLFHMKAPPLWRL